MLKKTVIIIMITILVLVLVRIIFIDSVIVTYRGAIYVDDYNEFYLFKKEIDIQPFLDFGEGGASGYKVWFLLGQKEKLLEKIKEDVNKEVTDMVANHSDILNGYKIGDDFKKIYIYYNKNVSKYEVNDKLKNESLLSTVIKVELYHEFIHGYGKTELNENIIDLVEVE